MLPLLLPNELPNVLPSPDRATPTSVFVLRTCCCPPVALCVVFQTTIYRQQQHESLDTSWNYQGPRLQDGWYYLRKRRYTGPRVSVGMGEVETPMPTPKRPGEHPGIRRIIRNCARHEGRMSVDTSDRLLDAHLFLSVNRERMDTDGE